MQYAIVNGARKEAFPNGVGLCPQCEGTVVGRCGEIYAWRWAHRSRCDCDSWAEGEGIWHRDWKQRFFKEWREVTIGPHRADIRSPQGVIGLQASSISLDEMIERESFYGEMAWLLDARKFQLSLRHHGSYVTFRWKHPRKTWWYAEKTLYFDLGTRLLRIHRIHDNIPCGGSGTYVSYDDFVKAFSFPKAGHAICDGCHVELPKRAISETGMFECYSLDIDPGTNLCGECHERRWDARIPDDPELFDCLTPLHHIW